MIAQAQRQPGLPRGRRKLATLRRHGWKCTYCGKDLLASMDDLMSAGSDHLVPTSRGGSRTQENRVPSCGLCNQLKSNIVVESVEHARLVIAARRQAYAEVWEAEVRKRHVTEGRQVPPELSLWRRLLDLIRRL